MTWSDLQLMLDAMADEPVMLWLCAVLAVAAGLAVGAMARRRDQPWPDTGDTQIPMQQAAARQKFWTQPLRTPQERRTHVPPYPLPAPGVSPLAERRKVRAGGGALKPSYDARRQTQPEHVDHHPV